MTLSLRRVSLAASLYYMFCALVCGAQNINVDQIRTGTTNNGNVVTTVNGTSVWAPAPGGIPSAQGTAPIQVNGASGTPAAGAITVSCPSCGGGAFASQVVVPASGSQTVNVNATSNNPVSVSPAVASSSNTSAQFLNSTSCANAGACAYINSTTVTWSNFTLPPGVNPANVTNVEVYISASLSSVGAFGGPVASCTAAGGNSANFVFPGNSFSTTSLTASFNSPVAGADVSSIVCVAHNSFVDSSGPLVFNIDQFNLIVTYTGSPVSPPDVISVAPPLTLNSASNILGLNPVYDYATSGGSSDAYTLTLPALVSSLSLPNQPPHQGQQVLWTPSFENLTTTPTLNLNGSGAVTITKGPGHTALAAGDLNGNVADTIFDGTNWELQNPQTPSGGGTSISVNGASVSNPNFNGTTPAAPSGAANVAYQVSSSNVSGNVPAATGSTPGVIKPDGTTCTVTSGVLTCAGSSGSTSIPICADTSGSGTAQSCTTSPSFTPVAGSVIAYTTSTANAGTALTENVNSLGAKPVAKWQTTTVLAENDVQANTFILETYDGTNWELSTIGNPPSGSGLTPPFNFAVAGFSSDNYTLTLPAFSSSTLAVGTEVLFTPPNFGSNTTNTPTLDLNSLGAITIVKGPGESGLAPNDIVAQSGICGGPCISDLIYDGNHWVLQNPQTSGQAAGSVTLSSGTATVTLPPNVLSCHPSGAANCVYQLTNCGPNSSTSLGILSVTNFPSGGAFTISSLTSTGAVDTADLSTVCWRIN